MVVDRHGCAVAGQMFQMLAIVCLMRARIEAEKWQRNAIQLNISIGPGSLAFGHTAQFRSP